MKIECTVEELKELVNIKHKDIEQDILNNIIKGIKNTER